MSIVMHLCSNCAELIQVCEHESDEEADLCDVRCDSLCAECQEDPQQVLALTAKLRDFGRH